MSVYRWFFTHIYPAEKYQKNSRAMLHKMMTEYRAFLHFWKLCAIPACKMRKSRIPLYHSTVNYVMSKLGRLSNVRHRTDKCHMFDRRMSEKEIKTWTELPFDCRSSRLICWRDWLTPVNSPQFQKQSATRCVTSSHRSQTESCGTLKQSPHLTCKNNRGVYKNAKYHQ